MRWKATALITFYVDADSVSQALDVATELAETMEPDRPIRYRGRDYRLAGIEIDPA